MTIFKVGDKVKVRESVPEGIVNANRLTRGKVYIVTEADHERNTICVDTLLRVYTDRFELVPDGYSLKKFEKDIRKFNERCGNVDCTPEMSLADTCATVLPQAKVILEEAKELLKACEEQNEQEILDGSIDVLVTSLRLLSLLGKRYDLMKAAELVMENNHLKYTDDLLLVQSWLAGTTYKMSGATVKDVKYYCVKDDNSKIRKWGGFPKVELNVEELRK